MKKSMLLWALLAVVLVAGCSLGNKKPENITDTKFEVEACNQYFELTDCILNNVEDEESDTVKQMVLDFQADLAGLDDEELEEACTSRLSMFDWQADSLAEIWCTIN